MRGKRHTTEEKIRILREIDEAKSALEVCRERNISEQTFYCWKRQFGMMEVDEAKRLREPERENGELKKVVTEALLKNRVLEAIYKK